MQSGDVKAGVFCLSSASTTTYFIDVVASNTSDKSKALLSQWWQVWQGFDTAGIKELYSDANHISVNSQVLNKEGSPSVSSWLTLLEGKLHRRYCQLVQVIANESNALVQWRIDADLKTDNGLIRVRLPLATMLTFKDNKIVGEYWVVDSIVFEKRFGAPLPF